MLICALMFLNVNFDLNLIFSFPIHSKYLPRIVQIIRTQELIIAFVQIEIQKQVLVIHVSVISAAIFLRTNELKQGIISGLAD